MPDCAYLLGVSASTLEKRIREEYDQTFSEFREDHLTDLRMKILDAQTHKALVEKDTTMLKHLGEHFLGQVPTNKNMNLNANIGSVEEYLAGLINKEGSNVGEGRTQG